MKVSYLYGRRRYPQNVKNEREYDMFLSAIGRSHTVELIKYFREKGIEDFENGCTAQSLEDRDLACWEKIKNNFLAKGDSLLDIGTNIGSMCFRMKNEGYNPTGLEQSADIMELLSDDVKPLLQRDEWKEIDFITAKESNALNLFGEKKFDAIFTKHVLEHVPNVVQSLQMWKKLARKGICGIVPIEDKKECWEPGRHTYRFSEKVLKRLLEEQGYKNVGICGFDGDVTVNGKFYHKARSAGYWASL